ncbi:MAG: FMN-binding protein [Acholeplasmataceae bacterium]|nr:FMN-binding protein [Acholeplasmataceae bacterium]
MSQNLKLIIFVVILGLVTSGLLLGADALTKDRIELNKEAKLKSAVLDGFDVSYTFANIHDIYADQVEIVELDTYTFYVDEITNRVSYQFEGSGLWGPIIGIITLESDFETIVRITILQQEETPGLGGVVAERQYLDNFVGKKMTPSLDITKEGANQDFEVDAITGATGTSNAFEIILNTNYQTYSALWQAQED